MANLPRIADCPLRNLICDGEVGTKECFTIRSAYQYGCAVTESKYLNEFKAIWKTEIEDEEDKMTKRKQAQRDYEASVEMAEYCERYEQTYNPEDGSM